MFINGDLAEHISNIEKKRFQIFFYSLVVFTLTLFNVKRSKMTDGFGSITWWGFSPVLDLQDKDLCSHLQNVQLGDGELPELNILMVGAGDCRHILKTLAHTYRWPRQKINFYILEANMECYARHLLLLTIALESQNRMGLQEKTELFMELFGNTLVRQQTCEYLESMSNEFIKMVTDFDHLEKKMPIIDMSSLKFKERDFLEGIFKFWRNKDHQIFDVSKCWDLRLRQYLGTRYDARNGVFDWDYNMKLVERGAKIIHKSEYNRWRNTGVAFEIREGNYEFPNKTLASGLLLKTQDGDKVARRGYWGDVLVGPFIAFGLESEEKSFFKTYNGLHTKMAGDVTEFNITSMLHEILNKTKYELPQMEDTKEEEEQKGPKLQEIREEDELEEEEEEDQNNVKQPEPEPPAADAETEQTPLEKEFVSVPVENFKVHFLPLNCAQDLSKKSKYQKLFNIAYFSNSMVHHLTPELAATLADKASVILELTLYMLELRPENIKLFSEKVTNMAKAAGCEVAAPCNPEKDNFARFTFSR
ncbi:dynein assembly factor 3, axonemal [Lingula anatina]|uniref:Dynein assembly factor 3, axonemal n=1 Tax=Lingula anatina TaxID=7574 RepID=A0A1S3IEE1_LINAN|nr:dynein assembly factor 3, axonemal [Lingula anatina]|eukprot:XP_013396625.1 dynein assembly factor 3, axonemal [Lingula anatina]